MTTATKKTRKSFADGTSAEAPALGFPVAGIGASAGGLEACTDLISHLPRETRMAFVFIQHLDPAHPSLLVELLSRHAAIPVIEAAEETEIEPHHLYVMPPNKTLMIAKGKFVLHDRPETTKPHMAIDTFFRSLAADQKHRSIGVLLSGTGKDGTEGLRAIKAEGGITFAQTSSTAKYPAMPDSAIDAGVADFIYAPDQIALELARIASESPAILSELEKVGERVAGMEDAQRNLFSLIRKVTEIDFSTYKPTTINRRVARRMVMRKIESLAAYVDYVREHPEEVAALYDDLLILVTSFFRDPDVFAAIPEKMLRTIMNSSRKKPLRVWVPGCSTGEEPYSLCMTILEYMERENIHLPVQLFATDISDQAIDTARRGVYSENAVVELGKERLHRFFVRVDNGWQVSKKIRDMCIFSKHDVTRDPPFSNIDIVSCRNLLIYLTQPVQKKVMQVFHYALNPTGYLLVGISETAGATPDLFEPIDKKHRIYRRKPGRSTMGLDLHPSFRIERLPRDVAEGGKRAESFDVTREVEKVLLKKHVSPAVLVDSHQEILEFYGDIRHYLEPAAGAVSLNLSRMMNQSIMIELHGMLSDVRRKGKSGHKKVFVTVGGEPRQVCLEVVPIKPAPLTEAEYFLIVMQESGRHPSVPEKEVPLIHGEPDEALEQLKTELTTTKETLQSVIEEHESTNEELRSALEELQSNNEELQSTNEELETAREELQSTNEELTTVNEELHERNEELNLANSDLSNFLSSVNIPIVILDMGLKIRRFTPAAEKALNVIKGDIGRPFADIRFAAETEVSAVIGDVLDSLTTKTVEIEGRDGRWYSLRVRPYRSLDNKIEGIVLVFIDIDDVRKALAAEAQMRKYSDAIVDTINEPLVVLDGNLRVQRANEAFFSTFGSTPGETMGRLFFELHQGQWDKPRLREQLLEILPHKTKFVNLEIEVKIPRHAWFRLNARHVVGEEMSEQLILLAMLPLNQTNGDADEPPQR